MRGPPVPPGAADLLLVVLERLRKVVMEHRADVGFVDAHPEGDRGDDDVAPPFHEIILRGVAHLRRHSRMVGPGAKSRLHQIPGHAFRRVLQGDVNHRRKTPGFFQALQKQPRPVAGGNRRDRQMQVRAAERGLNMIAGFDSKPAPDFLRHLRRGRGGERQHTRDAEFFRHFGESQIFGTEIVAPLRDAVRLVDRQQRDLGAPDRKEERLAQKPLGRDVEQFETPPGDLLVDLRELRRVESGIETRRRDAPRRQCVDLVLHQGDQRRNHQRCSLEQHRRKLIADRFAAARRQNPKRRPPVHQGLHNLPLAGPETGMAEQALQFAFQGGGGHRSPIPPADSPPVNEIPPKNVRVISPAPPFYFAPCRTFCLGFFPL